MSAKAYQINLSVSTEDAGDVSDDVVSARIIRADDAANSATVKLDTSNDPHAFSELKTITVTIGDGSESTTFSGLIDAVNDDPANPIVTVEARESGGVFDDVGLIGTISGASLFDVIDGIVDQATRDYGLVTFDPQPLKDKYDAFSGGHIFGYLDIVHDGNAGTNKDGFTDSDALSGEQTEVMLDFTGTPGTYENNTGTTYTLTVNGTDTDGNSVTGTLDLPPGTSSSDAFGTLTPKVTLQGTTDFVYFEDVTSISTDIGTLSGSDVVKCQSKLTAAIQTEFEFPIQDNRNARTGLDRMRDYLSGLTGNSWTYYVDESDALQFTEKQDIVRRTIRAVEGDNVERPIATRDMDSVRNFIKVDGDKDTNAWAWAYDGEFRVAESTPQGQDLGSHGSKFDDAPDGGSNAIENPNDANTDGIGLRHDILERRELTSQTQVNAVAKQSLRDVYPTHVSGTATFSTLKDVALQDDVEVYYPSRGIPQRVDDNIFGVNRVEYDVSRDGASTTVDFGTRPTATEAITDLVLKILNQTRGQPGGGGGGGGFLPVPATVDSVNNDGTVDVTTDGGDVYRNVEVI